MTDVAPAAAEPDSADRRSRDVRSRLHGSALALFGVHGIKGTTLQMIADDLGVTKAAVYYHYKTKEDLVLGVLRPLVDGMRAVVELAEAQRGTSAQREVAITGLADLTVRARDVYAVFAADPSVGQTAQLAPEIRTVAQRAKAVLAGPDPSPQTIVRVDMLLAGLVGPLKDPLARDIDDDALRNLLVEAGRVLLSHLA